MKDLSIHTLSKNLDDEQFDAVFGEYKDTICKANAGSGKTRVLTRRVAYMISDGIPEEEIILLTFTNKASREMIERVQELLGRTDLKIMSGTFHHVGAILLRMFSKAIGYKNNFSILTPDDAKSLIQGIRKAYLKRSSINKKDFPEKKVIYDFYSRSINLNQSFENLNLETRFEPWVIAGIKEVLKEYQTKKVESNALDFDDLLVKFREILLNDKIREWINARYKYILVDEYQDINWLQNDIIQLLNRRNHHLFAVGDSAQAIYGWRGSDVRFIENFERTYLNTNRFYIKHNYRSDGHILALAEASINHNYSEEDKRVITPTLPSIHKPILFNTEDDFSQANFVVQKIKEYASQGIPYNEIAVILRANHLTRGFEKAFRQNGIPYEILSGLSYFERKHVKDVLSFLTFINNPSDESAFTRIALLFSGLGEKKVETLFETYKASGYDLESLKKVKISKGAFEGFNQFISILDRLNQLQSNISRMVAIILTDFYSEYLKRTEDDYKDRMKDLEYLEEMSAGQKDLTTFLNDIMLDAIDEQEEETDNRVVITTVHKAKGLEWDCVFLPHLNEDIFPHSKCQDIEALEEERRGFYVAVTRARKHLNISYTNIQSFSYKIQMPSRFIREVDESLFDVVRERRF